mmetsp:Transcript_85717/g.223708  ORF Transcript_85717/g.223708 Transcript_85717/m.223708 type:complete len:306 (-) Transcript_85717:111-1028(-)
MYMFQFPTTVLSAPSEAPPEEAAGPRSAPAAGHQHREQRPEQGPQRRPPRARRARVAQHGPEGPAAPLLVLHVLAWERFSVQDAPVGRNVGGHLLVESGVEATDLAVRHGVRRLGLHLPQGEGARGRTHRGAVGRRSRDVAPLRPARQHVRAVLVHAQRVPEVRHVAGDDRRGAIEGCLHGRLTRLLGAREVDHARPHAWHLGDALELRHVRLRALADVRRGHQLHGGHLPQAVRDHPIHVRTDGWPEVHLLPLVAAVHQPPLDGVLVRRMLRGEVLAHLLRAGLHVLHVEAMLGFLVSAVQDPR